MSRKMLETKVYSKDDLDELDNEDMTNIVSENNININNNNNKDQKLRSRKRYNSVSNNSVSKADNHIDESVIIIKNSDIILDNDANSENKMYYSEYFVSDDIDVKYDFDLYTFLKEITLIIFINFILIILGSTSSADVITIDGIITSIIFYLNFIKVTEDNNFLYKNRLDVGDRYIYMFLIMMIYLLWTIMTSYIGIKIGLNIDIINYSIYVMIKTFMICPSVMTQIYNNEQYKKVKNYFHDGYNNLIQKIFCKQMAKVINLCIKNILKIDFKIDKDDITPFYDQFSISIIIRFILTFVFACLFNHMDKGGWKIPMIFYKNMYMKDRNYRIADDQQYLIAIVKDKNWKKFLDIYTLNRLIRLLINDDSENGFLAEQVTKFIENIWFSFNKIMFCWTVMSFTKELYIGILSELLFIGSSHHRVKYVINTLLFALLSYYQLVQGEKIIIIILCEIMYPIINSKLLVDILTDIYANIKKIVLFIMDKIGNLIG